MSRIEWVHDTHMSERGHIVDILKNNLWSCSAAPRGNTRYDKDWGESCETDIAESCDADIGESCDTDIGESCDTDIGESCDTCDWVT